MRPLEGFQSSRCTDSGDAKMFLFAIFHFFLESFSGEEVAPSRQGGNDEEDEEVKKKNVAEPACPPRSLSNPNITGKRGSRTKHRGGEKSACATATAGNQPQRCLGEKDEMNADENKDATREIKQKMLRGGWF